MRVNFIILITLLFSGQGFRLSAQEYKTLHAYQKETGNKGLQPGCWLKKDRKDHTKVFHDANVYNLTQENGSTKYKTLTEMCDFYLWFDRERKKQGHEIKWIGIAQIVATQLSNIDIGIVRVLIVRDEGVVAFAQEGCEKVLAYAFPKLKEVYFSKTPITGKAAEAWDTAYGMGEQCEILEPVYKKLSDKTICKLDRMAKGKGLYVFAVPKRLRFQGSIEDCRKRFEHGRDRLAPELER